jgi:hypothetical protein
MLFKEFRTGRRTTNPPKSVDTKNGRSSRDQPQEARSGKSQETDATEPPGLFHDSFQQAKGAPPKAPDADL